MRRTSTSLTLLVGILVVSFNLRIGIVSVGPVVDDIRSSTGMSNGAAGLLGAVPFLCMGVFALAGPPLAARFGSTRMITFAVGVLALGTLARALAPSAWLVILATVPIGVGIALTGLALPGVVKAHFPGRLGATTGSYVAALAIGAGVTALAMVPLARALDGWRDAFALSAVPAIIALPVWVRATAGISRERTRVASPSRPQRRPGPQGLRLGLMFGLQSMCFASVINWIAALYRQTGWSAGQAAVTTAVITLLVAPAGIVLPRLSDGHDRRPWIFWTAVFMSSAILALSVAPRAAPWVSVTAFGLGTGSIFSLMLTLPLDLRESQAEIDELTGWMLGLGYVMSAAAPALVGLGRDLTGNFEWPLLSMSVVGIAAGLVALSPVLRPAQRSESTTAPPERPATAAASAPAASPRE